MQGLSHSDKKKRKVEAYYYDNLDAKIEYQHLTKRLAEERERRARKFKDPERGQTSLDNFYIER